MGEKINTYEEAFRKIRDATGVSDVSEVISKFLTQEETQKRLMEMTKESQLRIDSLQEEKALAKHRVEEIKFSGNVASGTRRLVDDFETLLSEANSKGLSERQGWRATLVRSVGHCKPQCR